MELSKGKLSISRDSILRKLCRNSFYRFVQEFWDTIITEKPVWNWHIEYLCDETQVLIEDIIADKPRRHDMVVNIPPSTSKSTIFSVMLTPFLWTIFPTGKIITASNADMLGQELSRRCRMVIESEKYKRLFPEVQLKKDQNTKSLFVNTDGGSRLYCTVGGKSPIGFHAHIHVQDDPLDPEGVRSEADLLKAQNFQKEVLPQRKVRQDLTPSIIVMQRLGLYDPSGYRLSNKGMGPVRHINLPAEASDKIRPKHLVRRYKKAGTGEKALLDPVRLPHSVLKEKKALGQFTYAGQFCQDPVPLGGGMFKVSKLIIETTAPKRLLGHVRYWDKAATHEDGAYTVGVKIAKEKLGDGTFRFWVLDVVRGQWSSNEREDRIKLTAGADTKKVIVGIEQEGGSGGKESAEATVRRLAGYRVRADHPTGDKMIRADPFSVQVNAGNVVLLQGPWNNDYINELEHFSPASPYKDQVDATSGAFKLITTPKKKARAIV